MKPFDSFYPTPSKKSGAKLDSAVKLADKFRREQLKENFPDWIDTLQSADVNQSSSTHSQAKAQRISDDPKAEIDCQRMVFEERDPNKLKPSNLNKRRPEVNTDHSQIKRPQPKEIYPAYSSHDRNRNTSGQISLKALSSSQTLESQKSQMESIMDLHLNLEKIADNMRAADSLTEKTSFLRDHRESVSNEDVELLMNKICEFCKFCNSLSDENLKTLVKLRLGSYLNAMIHLLDETADLDAQKTAIAKASLATLFNNAVHKTLGFVGLSYQFKNSPTEDCSQNDSIIECSTQTYSGIQNLQVQESQSPPQESILTETESQYPCRLVQGKDADNSKPQGSLISDHQSTTVKLEDSPSESGIQFKLRKKVCKKIRSILVDSLGVKVSEAEYLTLTFEQTIFSAFGEPQAYIQAIKAVCNSVKVASSQQAKRAPVAALSDIAKTHPSMVRKIFSSDQTILQFSTI